jgi:hypothetical protein
MEDVDVQDGQERVRAIQRHLLWQVVALVCIIGGFYAIYSNKVRWTSRWHVASWLESERMQIEQALYILGYTSAAPLMMA